MLLSPTLKAFTCASCELPTWNSVCKSCTSSLKWNQELLPSPISELEALSPLLFSYSRTQTLIRRFKEYGGSDLKRTLLKMPSPLKHKLMETHFFAIIPIPQESGRSYVRGHESAMQTAQFFSRQLMLPVFPVLKLKNRSENGPIIRSFCSARKNK